MEENIKDSGKIITCMDMVFTNGTMAENMKECILWIRKMDTEFTLGLMEEFTRVNGQMACNMDTEAISIKMHLELVNGKKAIVLIGLKMKEHNSPIIACLNLRRKWIRQRR